MRMCSISGCGKPHVARGCCSAHYWRWSKYGDPLGGGRSRAHGASPCSVEGCTRPKKSHGLCQLHYWRLRTYGDPVGPGCGVVGCFRFAGAEGLCRLHLSRLRAWGNPETRPECAVEGCHRKATQARLCSMHYSRVKRRGTTGGPGAQRGDHPLCAPGHRWCRQCASELPMEEFRSRRSQCRACKAAEARASRYGISSSAYAAMLNRQNGCCAICGRRASDFERRLAVDHDHACCQGNRSCGSCVRGLLCGSCNDALGLVREDPHAIRGMLTYLGAT